jgi:hypothetical protein
MKKKVISSIFLFCINATIFSYYTSPILLASESKGYADVNTEFNFNSGELNLSEFESSLLAKSDIEQVIVILNI